MKASEVVEALQHQIAREGDGPVHLIVKSEIGELATVECDTSDRTSYTLADED